jgi:hapalindole-type alkaloid chlorinase
MSTALPGVRSTARGISPLYNFVHIQANELGDYPDGLVDICNDRIDGIVIGGAFTPEEVNRVRAQLTRRGPFPGAPFGDNLIYGPPLLIAEEDLTRYRREAAEFRHFCRGLFSGGRDFEARIGELLGAMAGGRPVDLPCAPDGGPYTPATIRVLEVDQEIGWHFENQFLHATVGYRHLSTLIDHTDHFSYFVVLEAPEAGGELVLYDLAWERTEWLDKEAGGIKRTGTVDGRLISDVIDSLDHMSISPPAGSLVVFDGGNILHCVSAVQDRGRRITIGGFVAFSKGRQGVYYWS